MIQTSVSIPILESEIETINLRAENSVNSLLNYIGLLERELKKREIENKELLQGMDKVKKELRKQYDG
jgi:hypothetical protein